MLTLKNLTVKVGEKTILKDINFNFEKGKIYAVLGPNGSGKSTLVYTIIGAPKYEVDSKSEILFKGNNITELTPDAKANLGIFLSFQTPLSIQGVRVYDLLQLALNGKKDPLALRTEVKNIASKLKIDESLLNRSLNEEASGGERKKMEVLQAALLDRELQIFDEVDTGVDVDSLKKISQFLKANKKDKTYIIITHNNRIFNYLKPDKVIVLIDGQVKKIGDYSLAIEIEKNGYAKIK